jgi:hypothetical protein
MRFKLRSASSVLSCTSARSCGSALSTRPARSLGAVLSGRAARSGYSILSNPPARSTNSVLSQYSARSSHMALSHRSARSATTAHSAMAALCDTPYWAACCFRRLAVPQAIRLCQGRNPLHWVSPQVPAVCLHQRRLSRGEPFSPSSLLNMNLPSRTPSWVPAAGRVRA